VTELAFCGRIETNRESVQPDGVFEEERHHVALQAARERQATDEFRQRYAVRAGVEGTISQGTRSFDLRRARYIGLAKTHLQHILVAAAINLQLLGCSDVLYALHR
jgi:transposase